MDRECGLSPPHRLTAGKADCLQGLVKGVVSASKVLLLIAAFVECGLHMGHVLQTSCPTLSAFLQAGASLTLQKGKLRLTAAKSQAKNTQKMHGGAKGTEVSATQSSAGH